MPRTTLCASTSVIAIVLCGCSVSLQAPVAEGEHAEPVDERLLGVWLHLDDTPLDRMPTERTDEIRIMRDEADDCRYIVHMRLTKDGNDDPRQPVCYYAHITSFLGERVVEFRFQDVSEGSPCARDEEGLSEDELAKSYPYRFVIGEDGLATAYALDTQWARNYADDNFLSYTAHNDAGPIGKTTEFLGSTDDHRTMIAEAMKDQNAWDDLGRFIRFDFEEVPW